MSAVCIDGLGNVIEISGTPNCWSIKPVRIEENRRKVNDEINSYRGKRKLRTIFDIQKRNKQLEEINNWRP